MAVEQIQHGVARELPARTFRDMRTCEEADVGIFRMMDVDAKARAEGFGVGGATHWPVTAGRQQGADKLCYLVHEVQVVVAAAVPFKQHKLASVFASFFFAAKDMCQLVEIASACGEQDFQRIFRRGLQVATIRRKRDELRVGDAAGTQLGGIGFDDSTCGKEAADGVEEDGTLV